MADYKLLFDEFCNENDLHISYSTNMPVGNENSYGIFRIKENTIYINERLLFDAPEYEKLYYFYHELRHMLQYKHPEKFDAILNRSKAYIIMLDGTCYFLHNNKWEMCKLEGSNEYFEKIYRAQPYEIDANNFAYEKVKSMLGPSDGLDALKAKWDKKEDVDEKEFEKLYEQINNIFEK